MHCKHVSVLTCYHRYFLYSGQGAEVMPLTSGEIHLQVEAQQLEKPAPVK